MNLFPSVEELLCFERKFGDFVSDEDLDGVSQLQLTRPRRSSAKSTRSRLSSSSTHRTGSASKREEMAKSQPLPGSEGQKEKEREADNVFTRGEGKHTLSNSMKNSNYLKEKEKRALESAQKNFISLNKERVRERSGENVCEEYRQRHAEVDLPPDGQVFMYSGQRKNIRVWQKNELRKKLREENDKYFTYSKEFISLSATLIDEDEMELKEKREREEKFLTKGGFQTLPKADPKLKYRHHKRPSSARKEGKWWNERVCQVVGVIFCLSVSLSLFLFRLFGHYI